ALAGVLLVILPLSMLYIGSLVAYLALFGITWFMDFEEKREQPGTGKQSSRSSGGFKEVFPIIKGLPIVFMTLILTLVPLLFLGGFNLMVINISELQDSSSIKGLIYTAEGIGFMLGAFIVKQI